MRFIIILFAILCLSGNPNINFNDTQKMCKDCKTA